MNEIVNPHDRAFRSSMANKQVAQEFFEQHLPAEVKAAVDFESLVLCPESYVDEELRLQICDVVYSAKIKEAYPYTTDIKDLVMAPRELIDKVLFQPYTLIDAHELDDENLKQQHLAGLMQYIFKHIYERDILPYLEDIMEQFKAAEQQSSLDYLLTLVRYVFTAGESQDNQKVLNLIISELNEAAGEKVMTIAEQLRLEGEKRGFQAGMMEGKLEGKLEGEAAILLRLLKRKFGTISADYLARIDEADADTLLEWGERILDAQTLDDVFAG